MLLGRPKIIINPRWLAISVAQVNNGTTTIEKECLTALVIVSETRCIIQKVDRSTYLRCAKELGLTVTPKKGKPTSFPQDNLKRIILDYQERTKMHTNKVYEMIAADAQNKPELRAISRRMVYDTLKENGLLQYEKKTIEKVPRCRYEACHPNLIWHTDLHNFPSRGSYLIAFIDDFSRYVVHFELIPSKAALVTHRVLLNALQKSEQPFSIWSDNGGEFMAEFKGELIRRGIRHVTTMPRNPEQNGKCERFWRTADSCKDFEELKKWIDTYNSMPHFGLPQIQVLGRKVHMSPKSRYEGVMKWDPRIPPAWKVDGQYRPFNPK